MGQNIINIFHEKPVQNKLKKLVPDLFLRNENWAHLNINIQKCYSLFLMYVQVEDYQNKLKLSWQPFPTSSYKNFLKTKRCLKLVSLPQFLHDFWRKCLLPCILLVQISFLIDCLYFWRYWGICALLFLVT